LSGESLEPRSANRRFGLICGLRFLEPHCSVGLDWPSLLQECEAKADELCPITCVSVLMRLLLKTLKRILHRAQRWTVVSSPTFRCGMLALPIIPELLVEYRQ